MYPLVDPNLDIYELGYSFFNNQPISNKFESFWDTRRGKRYSRYIQYRKYRDMIERDNITLVQLIKLSNLKEHY